METFIHVLLVLAIIASLIVGMTVVSSKMLVLVALFGFGIIVMLVVESIQGK